MLFVCLAGKGDQGIQNPGGQVDRPVNLHFLERSVLIVYRVFGWCEKEVNMKGGHGYIMLLITQDSRHITMTMGKW